MPEKVVPIYYCSECHYDLRKSKISPINEIEFQFQSYINDSIRKGYNDLCQYSFHYFEILKIIAVSLRSSSKISKLNKIVNTKTGMKVDPISKDLRYWTIEERRQTFILAFTLLNNLSGFKAILEEGSVTKGSLYIDLDRVPYFMTKLLMF
jgi:hypothetical protein